MWKKVLTALGFIGILIAASVGGQIGKEVGKAAMKPSQQEVEAKLVEGFTKAANQYNQRLPMMVDQDTRLDKVTVGPGPRAVYHYTFPKCQVPDDCIDPRRRALFIGRETMRELIEELRRQKS